MRPIFQIAKQELRTLFFSPIAWLVLVLFLVQSAFLFYSTMQGYEYASRMNTKFTDLTMAIYGGNGFFNKVKDMLLLMMPLLTMGLMSREYHSGSIKLLMSSPVVSAEIVFGKYLGVMSFVFVMMLVPACLTLAGSFMIIHQDWPMVISAWTGVFLLMAAYASIGLFMSSLTPYQIVAAISTMASFAALNGVGKLWQHIDFVRDITYYLSMADRTWDMTRGLIVSRDLFYYLVVITLFLGLMFMRLENSRHIYHWRYKTIRYAGLVVACLLVIYVSSRPTLQKFRDVTDTKTQTLMPASKEVVSKIKGPLKVHILDNLFDGFRGMGLPWAVIGNINMFEQYQQFLPPINIDYTYYYDSTDNPRLWSNHRGKTWEEMKQIVIDWEDLDENVLTPAEMRKKIDLSKEEFHLVRQLEANGKRSILRQFNDIVGNPMEGEISAALKRLTDPVQTIGIVRGHGERSIDRKSDNMSYRSAVQDLNFRFSFINYGFDIRKVSLADSGVSADVNILAIIDPQLAFSQAERTRLQDYLRRGGNLLVAGEPGKQAILNPLLAGTGIQFMAGALAEQSQHAGADFIRGQVTAHGAAVCEGCANVKRASLIVEMQGAMTMTCNGPSIDTIVATDPKMVWNRPNAGMADTAGLVYRPERGDLKGLFPLIVQQQRMVGNKRQRIVVTGDADMMNNVAIEKSHPMIGVTTANFDITRYIVSWLSENAYPLDVTRPPTRDTKVLIKEAGVKKLYYLSIWILPALIVIAATTLLIRRRNQ